MLERIWEIVLKYILKQTGSKLCIDCFFPCSQNDFSQLYLYRIHSCLLLPWLTFCCINTKKRSMKKYWNESAAVHLSLLCYHKLTSPSIHWRFVKKKKLGSLRNICCHVNSVTIFTRMKNKGGYWMVWEKLQLDWSVENLEDFTVALRV